MLKKRKSLTSPEVLITNVSLVELFHSVFADPQVIIAGFKHGWPFGNTSKFKVNLKKIV
jgi:hypothetical protein